MLKSIFTTLSKTFLLAFIFINFFNLLPLNITNYIWIKKVCMLFVDTSSLFIISSSLDLLSTNSNILQLNNSKSKKLNVTDNYKNKRQKRSLLLSFIIYLFICLVTFINIFIGLNTLDKGLTKKIFLTNKQEKITINQLKSNNNDISKEIEEINKKKNFYINSLEEDVSRTKFIHLKESLRIIFLSLVWSLGFYRLYKILCS